MTKNNIYLHVFIHTLFLINFFLKYVVFVYKLNDLQIK